MTTTDQPTPTPETDKETQLRNNGDHCLVSADFARRLERELSAARETIKAVQQTSAAIAQAGTPDYDTLRRERDAAIAEREKLREALEDWMLGGECFCVEGVAHRGPCSYCKTRDLLSTLKP